MRTRGWSLGCLVALVALLALNLGAFAQNYEDVLPEGVDAATVDGQPINAEATPEVDTPTPVFAGTLEPGPTEVEIAIQQNGDVVRFTLAVDAETGDFEGTAPNPLEPGTYSLYFDDELIGTFVVVEEGETETTGQLDLPAMTLGPDDVEVDGFGLVYGRLVTLEEQTARIADEQGNTSAENLATIADALRAAGWQLRYENRVAQASEDDPGRFSVSLTSYVVQFADDATAGAEFAAIAAETGNEEAGAGTIGDESEISRIDGVASDTGTPFQGLTVSFRVGNVVAGMTIRDFTNADPGLATVEDLAGVFAERIAAVRAQQEEGLSTKALRLDLSENGTFPEEEETYELLDGRTYARFGDADGVDATRFGDAGEVYAATVVGALRYTAVLYRFADEGAATAWLEGVGDRLGGEDAAYSGFEEVADAAELGDGSAAYSFDFEDDDGARSGTRFYVQVGSEVAQVEVITTDGTTAEAVAEVAEAQIVCLEAGSCIDPIPVPTSVGGAGGGAQTEAPTESPEETPVG